MLKSLTHIAWAVLLIAACLFTRLHCCPDCSTITRTDTVWVKLPPVSVVDSNPVPVHTRSAVRNRPKTADNSVAGNSIKDSAIVAINDPCDSIRDYVHQAGDSLVQITVESSVQGAELFNRITFSHQYPVVTNTVTEVRQVPCKFMVYGLVSGSVGVHSDLLIGGGVMLRRLGVQYNYGLVNRSHQVGVGVRLW